MKVPFVDLSVQYQSIKAEMDNAIASILKETTFVGGAPVKNFEQQFASLLAIKNCIGVGNGTDAIYIALKMLGIGSGDEVITSAASWISTSETITQTGAKVVFVDIDPHTYCMDSKLIEAKINSRTKAIVPVHLYGHAAPVKEIATLCKKHKLFLVEDCAQSHFTKVDGRYVGTFGDAATFSFYPGKNLGAYGDAGCIVTNSDELAMRMRQYANHGALVKHKHDIEGINSRLDSLQAAILTVKAGHILNWNEMRRQNATHYTKRLANIPQVSVPTVREGTEHTWHLYVIRASKRDQLKKFLESQGVQTALHYPKALPNLKAYHYLGYTRQDFPVASGYENEILSLPMFPELSIDQIEYVCDQIDKFYKQ